MKAVGRRAAAALAQALHASLAELADVGCSVLRDLA